MSLYLCPLSLLVARVSNFRKGEESLKFCSNVQHRHQGDVKGAAIEHDSAKNEDRVHSEASVKVGADGRESSEGGDENQQVRKFDEFDLLNLPIFFSLSI